MKRLRNKMTTGELVECLGVAKQTVNRWTREKGWKTEKFPDVKGGRARLILVDMQVCEFIQNTPTFHNIPMFLEAKEPLAGHAPGIRTPVYRQIISVTDNMTHSEQEKVAQPLSCEGIHNSLACLDINELT